jgi:hypothetical protein
VNGTDAARPVHDNTAFIDHDTKIMNDETSFINNEIGTMDDEMGFNNSERESVIDEPGYVEDDLKSVSNDEAESAGDATPGGTKRKGTAGGTKPKGTIGGTKRKRSTASVIPEVSRCMSLRPLRQPVNSCRPSPTKSRQRRQDFVSQVLRKLPNKKGMPVRAI